MISLGPSARLVCAIAVMLSTAQAFAESDRDAVTRLTSEISASASSADPETLGRVRRLLELAHQSLAENTGASAGCVKLASGIYAHTFTPADARAKALHSCRGQPDVNVIEVVMPVYSRVFDRQGALEQSLRVANDDGVRGRAELLRLALAAWSRHLDVPGALERSLRSIRNVSPSLTSCVRDGYEVHLRTKQPSSAFEDSLAECRAALQR